MLHENEKRKILFEEIYRTEIRNQLNKDVQRKYGRVWNFLNSSFGIWFLSSVILSLASWAYLRIQSNLEDKKLNKEIIEKYDIEISGRIQNYSSKLKTQNTALYFDINKDFLYCNSDRSNVFVFQEFKGVTTRELLLQLLVKVPDYEKTEVENAIKGYLLLDKYRIDDDTRQYTNEDYARLGDSIKINIIKLDSILNVHFKLTRWQKFK